MSRRFTILLAICFSLTGSALARTTTKDAKIRDLLGKIGVSNGICVVLGDPQCDLAIRLAKASDLLLYLQLPDDEDVQTASRAADEAGLYGNRIFVEKGALSHLHLADNMADALVAQGSARGLKKAEALRVLRPEGKALVRRKSWVKPVPDGIDDWTHPYHGPDNNPQSKDSVARAPYLTQFLAEPYYAPVPQVAVSSNGRVFKAFGHIAFKPREEPFLNTVAAFNGYNGTLLWRQRLSAGVMVHRNTMVATPDTLYVGDDMSCKLFDTKTGEPLGEIVPPTELAGGTFWKWMAIEDEVLYALVGTQEQKDPTIKLGRKAHGWPWDPLSQGYNQKDNPWGFGKNLLAIDTKTRRVLWSHRENEPADSRAVCMKNGRIFLFRFGTYLTCLDAKSGDVLWRKTPDSAPQLFAALGEYSHRQGYQTNWRTTAYLKCSDNALYFAGPQVEKLLALSTKDGSILWEYPYNNFQLILRDDGLYGISGHWKNNVSRKFDPMTGEILAELDIGRRGCTRPTGAYDAIFFRAMGGSTRFDLATNRRHWVSPMRPNCHDGVTVANGLLYWWPSGCDCQLTLYGITCLGPAGDFEFSPQARDTERLVVSSDGDTTVVPLASTPADWPTFRANNQGTARSNAVITTAAMPLWRSEPRATYRPTAPVAVGDLTFISGSDGIVRALDTATGQSRWTAYVGGGVRVSPTVASGKLLVGSGDGRVYAFEAQTGRQLWSFRAAPIERKIPVYGALQSTWPVAGGVRVEDGVAYVAAGIVNYDGTHLYALDADTGKVRWQNSTSGHLDQAAKTGVSVQGPMLVHDEKLYLPGGTSVSPAVYNLADGSCLNDASDLDLCESSDPRGWELFLIGDKVVTCGQPYYRDPDHPTVDPTVTEKTLLVSTTERDVAWVNNKKVQCFNPIGREALNKSVRDREHAVYMIPTWGKLAPSQEPLWEHEAPEGLACVASDNAVVVVTHTRIIARNIQDGSVLWTHPLPAAPVPWGLAVDREGRVIVTLRDGQVVCFG